MADKRIHDVKQVKEVRGGDIYYIGGKEMGVNEYLSEGWILLHIYSDSIDSDHGPAQTPVYVLGWTKDEEAPSEKQARVDAEKGKKLVEEMRKAIQTEHESNP